MTVYVVELQVRFQFQPLPGVWELHAICATEARAQESLLILQTLQKTFGGTMYRAPEARIREVKVLA